MKSVVTSDLKKVATHTLIPWAEYLTHWNYSYFFNPAEEPVSKSAAQESLLTQQSVWHQFIPGSHGRDGGRERPKETKDLLGFAFGDKKENRSPPLSTGM